MPDKAHPVIGGIYRVGQVMTTGGMFTTCTAYNRYTNDIVGLFIVEFPQTWSVEQVRQLLQPLEVLRSLSSPHVIRIHDWGIDGSRAYIVTDPTRGVTLRYVLDTEKIDLERALALSRQIIQGLKALHEHQVIGIDLRPQLITIDSLDTTVRAQIDDIGLRSLLKALNYVPSQRADDIGYLDPRYVAPEYKENGYIGPETDVYQVGLLLFELVAGRLPFVGHNHMEIETMQLTGTVPSINLYTPDAPPLLQEVIDRALAKKPSERFASAGALLTALNTVQISSSPAAISATSGLIFPTADGVYAYLCYEQEGAEPQRFAIKQKSLVVGRIDPRRHYKPDIDLSKIDPGMIVSRKHARIRFEGTHFSIEDLKSHNKTRLGDRVLHESEVMPLQHGDIINLGGIRLKFEIPDMSSRLAPKAVQ